MPKKTAAERYSDRSSNSLPVMRLLTSVLVVGRLGERFDEQEAIDAIMMTNVRESVAQDQASDWLDRALDDMTIIDDAEGDEDFPYLVVVDPAGGELEPHTWWSDVTDEQLDFIQRRVDETVSKAVKKKRTFSSIMHRVQQYTDSLPYNRAIPEDVRAALEKDEKSAKKTKSKKKHDKTQNSDESASREVLPEDVVPSAPVERRPKDTADPVGLLMNRLRNATNIVPEADSPSSDAATFSDYEDALISEESLNVARSSSSRVSPVQEKDTDYVAPTATAIDGQDLARMLGAYAREVGIDCGPAGFMSDQRHVQFFYERSGLNQLTDDELFVAIKMMTVYNSGHTGRNLRVVEALSQKGLLIVDGSQWRRSGL